MHTTVYILDKLEFGNNDDGYYNDIYYDKKYNDQDRVAVEAYINTMIFINNCTCF